MEPSPETFREVGRLCAAWAFLESLSEITLWGILKIDQDLGQTFTWRLGMRERWQMIVREAKRRLPQQDHEELNEIKKMLVSPMRQRNIVIHGVINATAAFQDQSPPHGTNIPADSIKFARHPCWTIFIGEDAGKNFKMSTQAVLMIIENIHKITNRVVAFNNSHSYTTRTKFHETLEEGWPVQL